MGNGQMARMEDFTANEIRLLVKLERIGGIISLVAVLFIFIAYFLFPKVRNVQNTFIVFASVSNAGASIASIIAFDGLRQGTTSKLCKAQGFLFEMFMQSDPWWSMAMAVNVMLVFYFRATPDSFARWWWIYCLVCYGGPFIIAMTLLMSKTADRGPVYGEATIWCWVDRQWDDIRIYTYYMLIWICIVGSLVCYALVGYHVFRSRDRLRSLTASSSRDGANVEMTQNDGNEGCYATVTTEVQVVSSQSPPSAIQWPGQQQSPHSSQTCQPSLQPQQLTPRLNTQTPPNRSVFEHSPTHVLPGFIHYFSSVESQSTRQRTGPPSMMEKLGASIRTAARRFVIADQIKRAYLRTSFLFAMSVLVTWIPSSMNRINSWINGQSPYQFHVATAAVLPLQGLWNSIIFFVTSWNVLQRHRRNTAASAAAAEAIERLRQDSGQRAPGPNMSGISTSGHNTSGHNTSVASDDGANRPGSSQSETDLGDGDSRTIGSEIELQRRSKTQSLGTRTPPVG